VTKKGTTAVANSPHAALLTYPLFAKPIAEGSSKGVLPKSKIEGPGIFTINVFQTCKFSKQNSSKYWKNSKIRKFAKFTSTYDFV
jgi:hypothetical protein